MHFCPVRFERRRASWKGGATVLLVGLLLATSGQAQTLSQALSQAWARDPQAAALPAHEAEAQARAEVAAGLTPAPPSVALSSLSDRFNANQGQQEWELELAVPLWLRGQRAARALEADRTLADVSARRAALRLQVAGELREVWWQLALARQALDLATRRDAAAAALAADVSRRYQAGELARLDANLAQNERLAAQGEWLEARAALRQAEQAYRGLTGAEAPAELAAETLAAHPDLSPVPVHPQLAAAQAATEVAQARLGVAQQTRRDAPELALRLVRERGDFSAPYASAFGIKLTVPFSGGAKLRQETAAAQADASQAEAELALTRQRLEQAVAQARLTLETAQLQMAQAQARRALTADSLHLAEKSFALGESDLSTLLRARASALEADAFLHRQVVAQAASVSRLNQNLGVLP
jgi:cobalt-zinc-cadmium efflux system outer membrane protein